MLGPVGLRGGLCAGRNFSTARGIYSSGSAFVALFRDRADCWGERHRGGECRGLDFTGVSRIHSNAQGLMVAVRENGTAMCWGGFNIEGNGAGCTGRAIGAARVFATGSAFFAWELAPAPARLPR